MATLLEEIHTIARDEYKDRPNIMQKEVARFLRELRKAKKAGSGFYVGSLGATIIRADF